MKGTEIQKYPAGTKTENMIWKKRAERNTDTKMSWESKCSRDGVVNQRRKEPIFKYVLREQRHKMWGWEPEKEEKKI